MSQRNLTKKRKLAEQDKNKETPPLKKQKIAGNDFCLSQFIHTNINMHQI